MIDTSKIANSKLLTDFYGEWPSFHDAEVISIQLDRHEPSLMSSIYTFRMTSQIDDRGYYVLDKKAVVTFRFRDVVELSINEFNHQNVLFDLVLKDISDRQLEDIRFEVVFDSSYGMNASFKCRSIEVVSVEERIPGEETGVPVQSSPKAIL